MAKQIQKTTLVCFICRKKYAEVHLNDSRLFEYWFDFCDNCSNNMLHSFHNQMKRPRLRLAK